MSSSLPLIRVIIGPTASGKTAYAIESAYKIGNAAVISADSRQIYSFMDIGTAKPQEAWNTQSHIPTNADIVEGIDHFLLNIVEPVDSFTLSQWQFAAYEAIEDVLAQGKTPLLVGGTMLYIDSIVKNYSIPEVPPNESLRQALDTQTSEALYALLIQKDPAAQHFIESHHRQRIIRALEVIESTKKPFSTLRQTQKPRYTFEIIGLFPGWDVMKERITERAHKMIADGLLEEVHALRKKFSSSLPLLQTMNYKQAGAVLDGSLSHEEAITEMVKVNMRYAHRQMSWWKRDKAIISWK